MSEWSGSLNQRVTTENGPLNVGFSVAGPTVGVLKEVNDERVKQDAKWGEQNHGPERYFAILAEEFGETAKEVVEWAMATRDDTRYLRLAQMREELIQTAAVAVAMVECIDRNREEFTHAN